LDATIREVAGEQKAHSLGSKRSAQSRRASSSGESSRRIYIIVGLIAVAFIGGFIALVVVDARQKSASEPPSGVEEFEVESGHQEGSISYEQNPPAGGVHNQVWQNSGFYTEPVRNENAVHTQEHGAVWITYRPDLPQDEKERLREIVEGQPCTIASPYPDLPEDAPVVASAWGSQLKLEGADDPDLERFIRAFQQGPQTPEPGAACTGGVGDPA
jgi:hypothetical protein